MRNKWEDSEDLSKSWETKFRLPIGVFPERHNISDLWENTTSFNAKKRLAITNDGWRLMTPLVEKPALWQYSYL